MARSLDQIAMTSAWPSTELRLASLSPTAGAEQHVYLAAVVTLMWPFSPSSSSLSITASEEDFRLRLSKGQLRINFNGACASAVEAHGLQIGDKVMISLEGASFEELAHATARDVPWAVTFTSRLAMKVNTTAGWSAIDIDAPSAVASPPPPKNPETAEDERPAAPAEPFSFSQNENEWTTPGLFKRRLTWSSDEPSSAFAIGGQGLFDEEDDYDLEHRKKRPRFSSSFRLLEGGTGTEGDMECEADETTAIDGSETPDHERYESGAGDNTHERAPVDEQLGLQTQISESYKTAPENITDSMALDLLVGSQNEHIESSHPSHITMPPPPAPLPPLTTQFSASQTAPDSPSLKPVPSEQLPIISPFLNRGLAGSDYMGDILEASLRAQEAGVANAAFSPVTAQEVEVEVQVQNQYIKAPTPAEESSAAPIPDDAAVDSGDDFEREFAAAPEVFVVPAEESAPTESATTTTRPLQTTSPSSSSGPTISQLLAAQRRTSPSDDDRTTTYESDKDSLFDDSETEARHRLPNRRAIGRSSPLKTFSPITPRRSVPYTKPSRLNLETPSTASPGPISAGLTEAMPGPPKTPFLYLPTPSPKVERRGMGFPTSAPPRFGVGIGGGGMSAADRGPVAGSSPIQRRSNFWGASKEPVSNDLSAYFGRPKRVSEIAPTTEISPVDRDGDDTGASNTEEEISSFSTPNAGTDVEEEEEEEEEDELERALNGGFRSGVTTNLSDFPALSALAWGAVVDIIGVVCRFQPIKRAKGGQKDWYMTMRVVDSSLPTGITATILRPYKEALPTVDVGDVVLLRSFKISSQKRHFVATSTMNSAWAVWEENGRGRPVQISGPPVEYGDQEERYVEDIGAWYSGLDTDVRVEMEREREWDDEVVEG